FTADDGGGDSDSDGDTDSDTDGDTDTGEDEIPPDLPASCTADSVNLAVSGAGDGRWPTAAGGAGGILLAWAYDEQQEQADWDIQVSTCQSGIPPVIGPPQEPIAAATLSEKPDMAARGEVFGLAWLDTRWDADCQAANQDACQRDLAFIELTAAGQPANDAEPTRLTTGQNPNGRPVVAATPSGWIVAWSQSQGSTSSSIKALAVDGEGQPGAVHAISDDGAAAPELSPALAAVGDQLLIVWLAVDRTAVFSRVIGADGAPQGQPLSVVEGSLCTRPGLTAGSGGFLLTYGRSKGADLEIRALRLDTAGVPIGDEQRVTWTSTDTTTAVPAWSGSEWAVAWLSDRANGASECQVASCQPQVFLTVLGADGAPRAREVWLSEDQNFAAELDLAWDGIGWLGVFELWRNLRKQIHWGHAFCD
ncbi:MAG TPA: hypothetical protein VM285_11965, partial [Polyangia bacterium]|nr:hypothetical protein [Polyangia bacterium]